jgi:hypothetical protein
LCYKVITLAWEEKQRQCFFNPHASHLMTDENPTPSKRRRGAQPGNLNALKHGFYSRHFATMELKDLEALLDSGLDSEINLLRVATRRLLTLTAENTDVDTGIRLLTVLGSTASRLANLLRTEALLGGDREGSILDQLIAALTETRKEKFGDE